ncbi:MAG: GNAT family N-acetyltransferase [Ruminococcaceae bacterium]|nr:GNAT family N-acetyltransferase [Oscillospiraceae bacterium]
MKQIATIDDKEALVALYNICFPGEEWYCRSFFERVWKPEKTLVYRDGEKVVSMLHMFDVTLTDGCKDYSTYYIFGAGTHPDYRGKSIMRELIEWSEKINSDKDFAILIAASESLKSFYGKLGFSEGFSYGKKVVSAANHFESYKTFDFSKLTFNETVRVIEKMNDIYLQNTVPEVVYRRSAEFLFEELCMREATVYICGQNYVVAEFSDEGVAFAECMGEKSFDLAEQVIFDKGFAEALACFSGEDISLGMYKKIAGNESLKGYLNLLFN